MSNEKIEAFWENATADDVAETMKTGKPIPARVRNDDVDLWLDDAFLQGWINGNWAARGAYWTFCQVYREPAWYANKPDPGPEHRLLGKFPDEELKPGDECFSSTGKWDQSYKATISERQSFGMWYRRRIEPVKPKFAVGQMVKVVGPKVKPAKDWGKEMDRQIGFVGVIRSIPILEGEGTFYNLEGIGIWCFREDYLEAVEPVEHYLGKVEAIKQFIVGDTFRHPSGLRLTITAKGFEVTQ